LVEAQLSSASGLWKSSEKSACWQPPCSAGGDRVGHTGEHTSGAWSQLSPSQLATPLPLCATKPGAHVCTHVAP